MTQKLVAILDGLLSSLFVLLTGNSDDESENDDLLLQELFHVKGRLTYLLESNKCIQDEGIEDGLQLSESSACTLEASACAFIEELEEEKVLTITNDDDGILPTSVYSRRTVDYVEQE